MNRVATIFFKRPGEVKCDICNKNSCTHIDYALDQKDIQRELAKNDWKKSPFITLGDDRQR